MSQGFADDHYGALYVVDELAAWAEASPDYAAAEKISLIIRATRSQLWPYLLGLFKEEQGFPELAIHDAPTKKDRSGAE